MRQEMETIRQEIETVRQELKGEINALEEIVKRWPIIFGFLIIIMNQNTAMFLLKLLGALKQKEIKVVIHSEPFQDGKVIGIQKPHWRSSRKNFQHGIAQISTSSLSSSNSSSKVRMRASFVKKLAFFPSFKEIPSNNFPCSKDKEN